MIHCSALARRQQEKEKPTPAMPCAPGNWSKKRVRSAGAIADYVSGPITSNNSTPGRPQRNLRPTVKTENRSADPGGARF